MELLAHRLQAQAQVAQVNHHARGRVEGAAQGDFSVVGVAVDAAAAFGFNLALQGVRGVKEKALADGVNRHRHKRRIIAAASCQGSAAIPSSFQ